MASPPRRRYPYKRKQRRKAMPKGFSANVMRVLRSNNEEHFTDLTLTEVTVDNAATNTFSSVVSVAGGSTDITRLGDSISIKDIRLSGYVRENIPTTAGEYVAHKVRCMLVQWKGDATPGINSILQDSSIFDAANSPFEMDNFRKHGLGRCIWERVYETDYAGGGALKSFHNERPDKSYVRRVNFDAAGTDPLNNDIYFIAVSSYSAGTNEEAPVLSVKVRVTWIED